MTPKEAKRGMEICEGLIGRNAHEAYQIDKLWNLFKNEYNRPRKRKKRPRRLPFWERLAVFEPGPDGKFVRK